MGASVKQLKTKLPLKEEGGDSCSQKTESLKKEKVGRGSWRRTKKVETGKLKKVITVVEGRLKKTVWSSKERSRTQLQKHNPTW